MPRTSRALSIFPIALRSVEVRAIEDVTAHMRRITVGGGDMSSGEHDGFSIPEFRSTGFDDHVKLVLPREDGSFGEVGVQDGQRFAWTREALARSRDYTVRRVRDDELDLDFVLHEGGLASEWAKRAQVGDALLFAGPKTSADVSHDVDWHLLLADETALPAVGRWLEEAPARTRAIVRVEVPSEEDRQDLDSEADVDIQWLVRPEGVRPGYSTLLLEAVQELELPEGRGYAWCAGETLTIAPIRRHLRSRPGLAPRDVEVNGYWRRTTLGQDREAEPTSPTEVSAQDDGERADGRADHERTAPSSPSALAHELHEMAELLPPIAIRAAITLGLPSLIAAGTSKPTALAREVDIPIARLLPLLDALRSLRLLRRAEGANSDGEAEGRRSETDLELTALGEVMLEESFQERLDLGAPRARLDLGLVHLVDVLRGTTDRAVGDAAEPDDSAGPPPASLREWRAQDTHVAEAAHDRAERALLYNLQAISAEPRITRASAVVVLGDGGVPTAAALTRENPERRTALLVPPADARIVADRLASLPPDLRERIEVREWHPSDQVPVGADETLLVQLALDDVDDAIYRRIVCAAPGALVVVTDLADEAFEDDHVAADALIALTSNGVPLRTSDQHLELLRGSGFHDAQVGRLGWGFGASLITAVR